MTIKQTKDLHLRTINIDTSKWKNSIELRNVELDLALLTLKQCGYVWIANWHLKDKLYTVLTSKNFDNNISDFVLTQATEKQVIDFAIRIKKIAAFT